MRGHRTGKCAAVDYYYKITQQAPFQQKARQVPFDRHSSRKKKIILFLYDLDFLVQCCSLFVPKVTNSNFLNVKLGHSIMAFCGKHKLAQICLVQSNYEFNWY